MIDSELEELKKEITRALMEEAERARQAFPKREWIRHWAGGMEAGAQVAAMTILKRMSGVKFARPMGVS